MDEVIDIQNLARDGRDIRAAVILSLLVLLTLKMTDPSDSRHKIAVIEDLRDVPLKQGTPGEWIVSQAWRRSRQHQAAWIVTTRDNHEVDSAGGQGGIWAQSGHWVFLRNHRLSGHPELARAMGAGSFAAIKGLKTVRREGYAEMFIVSQDGQRLGRSYLSPFKEALYSADKETALEIAALRSKGLSTAAAIQIVLANRNEMAQAAE